MYRKTITFVDKETNWETLRKEVEIYEINLPKNFNSIPAGKETIWNSKFLSIRNLVRREKIKIREVSAVFTNPKNTVKVVIAGKDKKLLVFSRSAKVHGWLGLYYGDWRTENEKVPDVFDNLKKGTWILTLNEEHHYWGEAVLFISNETLKDVLKMLDIMWNMYGVKNKYSEFVWKAENKVPTSGTVALKEVLKQEKIFFHKLRYFKWLKRKERWDLKNEIKRNLILKKTDKKLLVDMKTVDGSHYKLEVQIEPTTLMPASFSSKESWTNFVYLNPGSSFKLRSQLQKEQLILSSFCHEINRITVGKFTISRNGKKIEVERTTTKNGSVLNYLNGKTVAGNSVFKKIEDYWLFNKPISPPKRRKAFSLEAERLLEEGLNGTIRDLEGEFPFHLNVLYKENERKWYLEIAGKEYYIKGGYNALNKVKSAIEGKAITDKIVEGYDPRATKVIRHRLAQLVGEKKALHIILQVKKMGALLKAMENQKSK